jgi:hypothetical protein
MSEERLSHSEFINSSSCADRVSVGFSHVEKVSLLSSTVEVRKCARHPAIISYLLVFSGLRPIALGLEFCELNNE